ncbi:hypothetical protein DFJ73DRAFT_757204 [Zopfochytrium polystomum]|nr:hypothetical protein DFJ73DRAFT_757204 [Zopfochytrium polystomum]
MHHQLLFRLPDDVICAICSLLTFLDLTRLACCCSLARSVVGRRFVKPLLIDPLLRIAHMSATKDCLWERPKDSFDESQSPFFFSILVAIRSYIDLSHTFDLQGSEEDHAILQSIPLLFSIDSILLSPAGHLDNLSAQAINSSVEVGQSLRLRPFELRLEFWKGLIDRAHCDDGDGNGDTLINLLTSSFESDQALEALQYLETYVKTHLGTLVERCKTISIAVENESDQESERESEEDPSLRLPRLLVTAVLALIPALSADSVCQAWDLLNVLEFTVKTQWSEPTRVFQSICTSPYWIPFWKQIVVREMDPNNCGKQPVWFVRFLDSDKVMGLALDTMLQTNSKLEIDKSDAPVYKAFIERQLKLLQPLCVDVIGKQAPKLIGILASVDCHLHGSCFPVLSNVLAQRGFVEHVQPLVQFLFRNIDYKWGFDSELVENMERVVMTVIRHLSFITLSDMVVIWNRIHEDLLYVSEALTKAFTEQMAILINKKSASIEDMERLLLEDLERETFKTLLVNVCLWNGFLVMKAVRLLRKQVVGFHLASPIITQSLMHLLSAYSSHTYHFMEHYGVPYMSNVQSLELDYVAQMLDPCSGLVITNNVASCLKEVWVESVFCEAWRYFELRVSEESPVTVFSSSGADFRRVLSTDIISIWKSVLERDATWFERVDFGERLKLLYKKYGLVWVAGTSHKLTFSIT